MELTGALFKPKLEKIKKKNAPKKNLIFREMELSGCNVKKFLIFSQKKACLIFRETEKELFYISGNFLHFKKLLSELKKKKKHPPLKNSLYFGKYNFLATSLKNFLYFRRNFQSLKKTSKKSALKKFLVSYVFTIFKAVKHRKIPCEAKIQHIFYGSR